MVKILQIIPAPGALIVMSGGKRVPVVCLALVQMEDVGDGSWEDVVPMVVEDGALNPADGPDDSVAWAAE